MTPSIFLNPAFLGLAMVVTFMTLIMTKRMSAIAALLLVPILFGLIAGAGAGLGPMMIKGVLQVAPTALMLAFAVLYFAIMMDAGLFDPLVRKVLATVGEDPVRIALGTAVLATVVSLDGDGTTTALIVITAMLPVYRKVGMNPLILATLLGSTNSLMNFVPWGGPSARAASAVHADLAQVFLPLLPAMIAGLAGVYGLAWLFGRSERRRLAGAAPGATIAAPPVVALDTPADKAAEALRRPRLFWLNLVLTVGLLLGMILSLAPLPVLMMGAFAVAVTINYPNLREQKARIAAHADNVVNVVVLIFSAGAFTGILNGTGMADAMATAALSVIPPNIGPFLAPITALASMPLTFVMSNDAYYFGVVPVIAQTAAHYGIAPEAIARASLIGQPVHALSPLLAPIYLACGLLGVDVADAQRFALKWAVLICLLVLGAALLTGAVPLVAG
ncbi:CitMHS family transporter [Caulobacter sp. UNC358MFTsu5.1]|uniref:CitMHS family transporter n=1 Tax=Caulobacter sp. UNC358MFTsu5.1 TaxID=1449049 RepID=UPI000AF13061|nr:citrate:proton symporter [Caulobacter sp. UNC358MFTsu5.1]